MNPKKTHWYLGSNSFATIMEQDRRHWLLKTDKLKQVQDTVTGDTFQGRIDNLGSDIIIETEKLYTQDVVVHKGTFSSENVSDVFDLASSVFSYIPEMNGLHFLRLKSINLMVDGEYHNFRLMLTDVEECYIPMAPDKNDPDVFVYKWYKTSARPILQMMDGNGQWLMERPIQFSSGVTNPVFYFPADEVLQPVAVDTYVLQHVITVPITDQNLIGYPLLWFTCDESNLGPKVRVDNNIKPSSTSGSKYLTMGHPGNASTYIEKLYPAVGIEADSVPTDTLDDWELVCSSPSVGTFDGSATDFTRQVRIVMLRHLDPGSSADPEYIKFINDTGSNSVSLNPDAGWVYDDENHTYSIPMSTFATNLYSSEDEDPLIAAFDVRMDDTILFEDTTTDTGFAGIRMGSSKNYPDQQPRYPHDLANLDGLPDWIRNNDENLTPQHLSVYAAHDTPFYRPSDQSTRQIAGLLFDPGVERSYDDNFHPGSYKLDAISIVSGGSGYNQTLDDRVVVRGYFYNGDFYEEAAHTTLITADPGKLYIDIPSSASYRYDQYNTAYTLLNGDMYRHITNPNRVWVKFNNGSRSRTLVEITAVDPTTGAATELNPLYVESAEDDVDEMIYGFYDGERGEFFTDSSELELIIPDESKVYKATNEPNVYIWDQQQEYILLPGYYAGSAYEAVYDKSLLTGSHLTTEWVYDENFTQEALMEARTSQLAGTGTGLMVDGLPWWYHTFTTGTGLVVAIDENSITEEVAPYTSDDVDTSEIGRVYVLSNDSATYQNNATAKNPKPERTIARICDIPTSIMQLSGIHGVAPTSVVDKKYIRSEATFTEKDQDYLYNGSKNRWVRPTALDVTGTPIYTGEPDTQSNEFVFDSMELLNQVDLMNHNDFRETTNLNRGVHPVDVSIAHIFEGGTGYSVNSMGIIVVGGYSFTYQVTAVTASGSVVSAELASNDDASTLINLANFDLASIDTGSGLTQAYGTSPLDTGGVVSGRGLRVILRIANCADLLPKKGPVFSDLFAFVSDFEGIWFVLRRNNQWVKERLVAQSYASDTSSVTGEVSLRDSYMNSILPSARNLPVNPMAPYAADIMMQAFTTASSINVVDTNCTPVHVPSTAASSGSDTYDDLTVIDINKMYCRGLRRLSAYGKSEGAVLEKIRENGGNQFDSYIFWRWVDPSDSLNFEFEYGIVHRSLNNLQSTDRTSMLPGNDLVSPEYVHTNTQTTIMWNVPHVGPMVWMFDPMSDVHEKYYVNAHTRDLYVVREKLSWESVEVCDAAGTTHTSIIENAGSVSAHSIYNVYSNSPAYSTADTTSEIYQQPEFVKLFSDNAGGSVLTSKAPRGSWRLVFPSIPATGTYKLKSSSPDDGREFTPVRMSILRGANVGNTTDVLNEDGDPVNYKMLLMDENTATGRVDLKVYDQESHEWSQI